MITIVLNLKPQSIATGYLITPSHVLNTFSKIGITNIMPCGIFLLSRRTISNKEKMRKAQKLDCLHLTYAKVVDAFVFLLCHRDSEQAGWSQTATNSCKKDTNIPFNEDT